MWVVNWTIGKNQEFSHSFRVEDEALKYKAKLENDESLEITKIKIIGPKK